MASNTWGIAQGNTARNFLFQVFNQLSTSGNQLVDTPVRNGVEQSLLFLRLRNAELKSRTHPIVWQILRSRGNWQAIMDDSLT